MSLVGSNKHRQTIDILFDFKQILLDCPTVRVLLFAAIIHFLCFRRYSVQATDTDKFYTPNRTKIPL